MAVPGNSVANSTVLFREVHKNAWLRRLPTEEKKIGAHSKKGERVWCVFCVHDDVEPFIEIYGDQKMAAAHKPDWCASLAHALHVSPTICPHDQQFEFVVTLPDTALRLSAPSWEVMMEWVDSIGCKLREMHVLSPKENVYSRQPESRAPLTPLLPTRDPNSPLPLPPSVPPMLVPGVEALSLTTTTTSLTSTLYISNSQSDPDSPLTPSSQNITVIEVSANPNPNPIDYEPSTAETSSGLITSAHTLINRDDHDDDDDDDTVNDDDSLDEENIFDDDVATVTCPPLPRLPCQLNRTNPSCDRSRNSHINSNNSAQLTSQLIEVEAASVATTNQPHRSSRTTNASASANDIEATAAPVPPASPALYEHVFLSSSRQPPTTSPSPPTSTTSTSAAAAAATPPVDTNSASSSSSPPPLSADLRYSQVQQLYQNAVFCERVVPPVNAIRPRSGLRPNRRRSSDSSVPADRIRRLQAPPHPFRQQPMAEAEGGVTLRERQVTQLRREMAHQGGVRLQLRRKDCLGSIALVDAFGAVWIAGWKQKEHPMLYNALHIGDKVISVAGVRVQSSCDAHKLIRGAPSLYVALVIRRVPCGRVLAVRREWEGQCVGVVQEGGTAEIKEVVAGGLAAQGGLPPRAPTHDGLSLTSWSLTEINGRPLNLFFKDNEVRDRLNAVGLDISFLVQPTDLVKQIRRQLKALRGYKDYIVQ